MREEVFMYLFIVLFAVIIVSVILIVVACLFGDRWDDFWYDLATGGGWALVACGLLASFVLGLVGINNHTEWVERQTRREMNIEIERLNNQCEVLTSQSENESLLGDDNLRMQIFEYNIRVQDFKIGVSRAKANRENPWFNWLVCPVYDEYTGDEVKFIGGIGNGH